MEKNIHCSVFQVKLRPHAKIQLMWSKKKKKKKFTLIPFYDYSVASSNDTLNKEGSFSTNNLNAI